jgi:hypothetical protein
VVLVYPASRVGFLDFETNSSEVSVKNNILEAEYRKARRTTHLGRVFFVTDFGFGIKGVAFLQDISTTGCRLVTESPLEIGMELGLSLVASSHERDIEIELAKVRRRDGNHFGLEFLAIDPAERERLRQFLKTV